MCAHSADLLPLGLPPAADLPPGPLRDLLHAAQVSTSLPPSLLASALPTVCGWLASFPRQRGDPSFWITPPLHVDAKWTAFWDTAHLPTTPLPPSPAYTRSSGPTSAWALHPALPDAPLVTSSACPDYGRPTPHTAFVDLPTSPTDHWPHFFCTSPHKAPPVCTRDIAARCVVGFQGMLLPGAVPVSAIPWAAPCAPPPRPPPPADPRLRPLPPRPP